MHIAPEALIGPYEVLDELGKGGMGVVYRARHVHLNRVAALKMILGGSRVGPEHYERFRTELAEMKVPFRNHSLRVTCSG